MEEWKTHTEITKDGVVLPFSTYLHHHLLVLEAVESKDLTPERLREISVKNRKLVDTVVQLDRELQASNPFNPVQRN